MRLAELHLHLEGSVRPETLQEIDPALTPEAIREHTRFSNFAEFLQAYKWVTGCLREPDHYAIAARRLLDELAAQNVVYAELNVSVGVMLWRGQDVAANFAAIEQACAAQPVRIRFLFDAVRQFGVEHVDQVAEWAIRLRDGGVVGFGIGGDEERGPVSSFRLTFDRVKAAGLHLVPHAGESAGPGSIWDSLEAGAERIGHGIRAIDDPALVKHLADNHIPLEICITSNLRTGVVDRLENHPIRRLFDAGVPIVLNTDDPALFETTLTGEYERAAAEFGFTEEELRQVAANGFRYAFDSVP